MWTQMHGRYPSITMFITSSDYAATRPCTRIFSAEQIRAYPGVGHSKDAQRMLQYTIRELLLVTLELRPRTS